MLPKFERLQAERQSLRVPPATFTVAGLKDSHALTTQRVTVRRGALDEQQIRLLSMEAQANGVGNAPAAAADGANTAPNGEASPAGQPTSPNSTTLPGFDPSNNGSAPVMEGQPYLS